MTQPPATPATPANPANPGQPLAAHAMTADQLTMQLLANPDRIREIASLDLDHPELRNRLDAIARQTRERLGAAVSLITLVLDSAQLIAGSDGLDGWIASAGGTPVEWSFCANAVLTGQPYVVEDAAHDPRQKDNPLVTQDGIASYCGVPLTGPGGQILGAHCIIGDQPIKFTTDHLTTLRQAADQISSIIDEHRSRGSLGFPS